MRPFVFDMETGDPDDFLTLALLCGHPAVNLIGVTVTPGTPHQIGVVRYCLDQFDLDIPVGAFNIDHRKAKGTKDDRYVKCVSDWHYRTFGDIEESFDAEPGHELLLDLLGPETTLVTGAPLKNIGKLLRTWGDIVFPNGTHPGMFGRIFVQGGFAGEGVVPADQQLDKFKGRTTCPTYNLNGDPKSALAVIAAPWFSDRRFVSKNVCHGVVYNQEMHARLEAVPNPHLGLQLILKGMGAYLARKPEGKKFHDPLAACCAIDPDIGTWADVELYREKGQWGSRLCEVKPAQERTRIIVGYDHDRFVEVLTATQ